MVSSALKILWYALERITVEMKRRYWDTSCTREWVWKGWRQWREDKDTCLVVRKPELLSTANELLHYLDEDSNWAQAQEHFGISLTYCWYGVQLNEKAEKKWLCAPHHTSSLLLSLWAWLWAQHHHSRGEKCINWRTGSPLFTMLGSVSVTVDCTKPSSRSLSWWLELGTIFSHCGWDEMIMVVTSDPYTDQNTHCSNR